MGACWSSPPDEVEEVGVEKMGNLSLNGSTLDQNKSLPLPPEMETAILALLPLRDRVRARGVCKMWKHLLDDNPQAWNKIKRVVEYLKQRAPITSLELLGLQLDTKQAVESLKALVSGVEGPELRSLAACLWRATANIEGVKDCIRKLVQSQPNLEKLVLGPFSSGDKHPNLVDVTPPLSVLSELPNLRVLVLFGRDPLEDLEQIPGSVWAGLDCCAVYSSDGFADDDDYNDQIKEWAPDLKRREVSEGQLLWCFIWAKEDFDIKSAMNDGSLHSRNFLDLDNETIENILIMEKLRDDEASEDSSDDSSTEH